MRRTRRLAGPLASLAVLASLGGSAVAAQTASSIRVLIDRQIPAPVDQPTDVRWRDDDSVWLSSLGGGVYQLPVDPDRGGPGLVEASRRAGWRWVHLATDGDRLAGAYPAFHLWWMDAKFTDSGGSYSLEHIGDLDLGGGRLLILGLQRNEAGALAADGKIAWLGRLGADLTEFRPVLPSRAGPGASTLQDCALLLMSKVRFLADGSFVVVPGVDPGIFLFDTTGRLVRTWETAPLNLDQGCLLDEAQRRSFSTDLDARMAWLDRRRVIDEVVPLGKDIGLIVRSRIDGTTRWELLRLRAADGTVEHIDVPVVSPSRWTHLRGDVRGDRLVLLLTELEAEGWPDVPPPRLIVAHIGQ